MADIIQGPVSVKRVYELINKLGDFSEYLFLIDKLGDDDSFNMSIEQLFELIKDEVKLSELIDLDGDTLLTVDTLGNGSANYASLQVNHATGDLMLRFDNGGSYPFSILDTGFLETKGGMTVSDTKYIYFAQSGTADTVEDTRISNNSGVHTAEKCTVSSGTKGGGTWVNTQIASNKESLVFSSNIVTSKELRFNSNTTFSDIDFDTDEIDSLIFETRIPGGIAYTTRADLAALNTYTEATSDFYLKISATFDAAYFGQSDVIIEHKKYIV